MLNKKSIGCIGLLLIILGMSFQIHAQPQDGLGQIIRISTRLHAFAGKPTWTLIIRDIDNNQTIPYMFDIRRGNNMWFIFTFGRNYLISASHLQFSPYRRDPYCAIRIDDFCHLETGRIIRGRSMNITITGELTANRNRYTCHISTSPAGFFTIVPQD